MAQANGGKNKFSLHLINAAHTTLTTSTELAFTAIAKTTIAGGAIELDTIQYDEDTIDFFNTYGSTTSSTAEAGEKVVADDGTSYEVGSSSSAQNFTAISYGPIIGGGTKQVVYILIGTLTDDSGEVTIENGKFIRPKAKILGVTTKASVTVVAACFDTDLVDTTTGFTAPVIPAGTSRPLTFCLPVA